MSLQKKLIGKEEKLAVVGLGYVGLPIAVAFAKKVDVIGFDINSEKINLYRQGVDPTDEIGSDGLKASGVNFTDYPEMLKKAKFIIVAVPTPINFDKTPDLKPVISASEIVGKNLMPGAYVVFESTVYPGVTENVCIPILEKESGLKCGTDFKVGYSPERVNPGDKLHRPENIKKVVSGCDNESLETISEVYELVISAGVHKVSSIRTAEAVKIAENSQRDINIAFMNELAMVFDRMDIDTEEVATAMDTKWNALKFRPGLVGGHCIGVDPYYFIYQAERLGYHGQIVTAGRKINDSMGEFMAKTVVKKLAETGKPANLAKVAVLGITFKENCGDTRNSKVYDIIKMLKENGAEVCVADPWADKGEAKKEYGIELIEMKDISDADCVIFAVAHRQFKEMTLENVDKFFKKCPDCEKVLIDVKSIFDKKEVENKGYIYWRL